MKTPTDNKVRTGDPVYTAAQDVLTDKRNHTDTLLAEPMTPEALLRSRLAAFAPEWDAPEMGVYDDYDAALVVLKESHGETR